MTPNRRPAASPHGGRSRIAKPQPCLGIPRRDQSSHCWLAGRARPLRRQRSPLDQAERAL